MYTWIKFCVHGTHIPPTEAEILTDEYRDLIKDEDTTHALTLSNELIYADQELVQLTVIRNHLAMSHYNAELCEILQSEPYDLPITFENFEADLKRLDNILRTKKTELRIKEGEYNRYAQMHGDQEPPTEADWYSQLRTIAKWQGHPIPAKSTTVIEYIVYLNDFKADVKRQNQANSSKGNV